MQTSRINQSYIKINNLIGSSRFNEALSLLKREFNKYDFLKSYNGRISATETTYRYLLDFMSNGFNDPSRDGMIDEIRESLYFFNDLARREELLTDSSDSYSTTRRMQVFEKATFLSRYSLFRSTLQKDREETENKGADIISAQQLEYLGALFNYVWTMFGADSRDYTLMKEALTDPEVPDYAKISLTGAILLGNTIYFDAQAFRILLDVFSSEISPLLYSALAVSISLVTLKYSARINKIPSLKSQVEALVSDSETSSLFNDIFIKIVNTYDTKRITRKMQDEVIPGLMKIRPEIIERMRNMASDSEDFLSDINPEWEDILEESGVQDKLQELNDMQLEGADVMMTTFSNLKNFDFFNKVSNWFLPFISAHPEINELNFLTDEDSPLSKLSLAMCDSDIYSFLLSMKLMPQSQREMMVKNISAQMAQAEEVLSSAVGDTFKSRVERNVRQYLQNLYRFFNLYRKKSDFTDPFENPISESDLLPLVSLLTVTPSTVKLIAEFYFKNKYYNESAGIWKLYDSFEPGDAGVWEKIAYCYDREGMFMEALGWYRKAELINQGSPWLEKKLAVCLKNVGDFKEALVYYKRILEKDPDNYHLLMSAGQCLLEAGNYEDALKDFYHAQYLKPEKKAPARAIAWTRLLSRNFEKAALDYEKLTSDLKVDKEDFLNAALAALASKDIPKALSYYRQFLNLTPKNDFRELMIALRDDAPTLKLLEIPSSVLRLVIDKLRYDTLSPIP